MSQWLWPCPGNNMITSGVGPRWGTTHKGIDISAPKGASVISSRSGEVIATYTSCTHNYSKDKSCGCGGGYGNYVYIDHKDGFITRYAHMTSVHVRVGDRISQGKVIGTVGSTGFSTGNHLHFEIRDRDNNVKDPEKYVNPSNSIYNADYTGNTTDRGSLSSTDTANDYNNPVTGDSDYIDLTPVMNRDFTKGYTYHAYLKIYIGEKELIYEHGKPSIIQSFEINRLEEAGSKAQFVLFDTNWEDIEYALAENWNNILMQYGYSDGALSPMYKMLLSDYSLDFKNTGVILSIQAISEGIYQNLKSVEFDTGTKNPTEAIRSICSMMGWDIDLSDFADTKDVDREENFKIDNRNPVTYITETILPEARAEGIYDETVVFTLDATEVPTAHLKVKKYISESNIEDASIPTYVYMKGYDSVVRDLSFHTKGVFGGTSMFSTVTGLSSGIFNILDKVERVLNKTQDTVLASATGDYSHTLSNQSIGKYVSSGETEDQLNAILNYHIKNGANQAYEATMVILGDPNIEILQEVRIINITDSGHLHNTSGIYMVTGISDSIQNGDFKTTLTLVRNANISTGITLKYPKYKKS